MQERVAELEQLPKEVLSLYSCGRPLTDDSCVAQLQGDYSIDVTVPLLGGNTHSTVTLSVLARIKVSLPTNRFNIICQLEFLHIPNHSHSLVEWFIICICLIIRK